MVVEKNNFSSSMHNTQLLMINHTPWKIIGKVGKVPDKLQLFSADLSQKASLQQSFLPLVGTTGTS